MLFPKGYNRDLKFELYSFAVTLSSFFFNLQSDCKKENFKDMSTPLQQELIKV